MEKLRSPVVETGADNDEKVLLLGDRIPQFSLVGGDLRPLWRRRNYRLPDSQMLSSVFIDHIESDM